MQPKIVLAENVKGLIQGNAKLYVKKIFKAFDEAGYNVQLFLLNAASMGVPQKRERVFFICHRKDLKLPKLRLDFNEDGIAFGIINNNLKDKNISDYYFDIWNKRIKTDNDYGDIKNRIDGKASLFSTKFLHNEKVVNTIVSGSDYILFDEPRKPTTNEFCQIGTYPLDYNFKKIEPKYLIGMSVPPVMTAQIANQIKIQWLDKL